MRRRVARVIAPLVLLLVIAAGVGLWGWSRFEGPGPLTRPVTVILEPGLGLAGIARRLEEAGVIGEPAVFVAGVRLAGAHRRLRAGEYAFEPGASPRAVMAELVAGRTVVHRLTLPEGLTSAEIVGLVNAADGLAGEPVGPLPEGALLPETYYYARGDTRAGIVARMERAMAAAVARLWADRAEGLALATPREAVILASIVEKETGRADERAKVAGVFLNRLAAGMALQSDPTVVYALTGGRGALRRRLARADLGFESPYNTYLHRGLPPGPIANPGRAAIEAVLHPAATDAFYFVADGRGGHLFAATLDAHNANIRRLRAERAEPAPAP